jgi:DNA-binding MarR family transcriptional regulator
MITRLTITLLQVIQRRGVQVESESTQTVVSAVCTARQIFEEALKPHCTLIAIDLLMAVARAASFDRRAKTPRRTPTVKELFGQLPHSARGARIHFNRLVAEGFLLVERGDDDRRTRMVRLSPRGEQLLRKACTSLLQSLEHGGLMNGAEIRSVTVRRAGNRPAAGA